MRYFQLYYYFNAFKLFIIGEYLTLQLGIKIFFWEKALFLG